MGPPSYAVCHAVWAKVRLSDLQEVSVLGAGAFGLVKLVRYTDKVRSLLLLDYYVHVGYSGLFSHRTVVKLVINYNQTSSSTQVIAPLLGYVWRRRLT